MSLLDIFFPKKCVGCKKFGEYLCPNCFAKLSSTVSLTCLVCSRPSFNGMTHPKCVGRYTIDGYFASLNYKSIVKKLLYQFKYQPYLTDLQTVLTDLLYEHLIQDEACNTILKDKPVLIPIPLSRLKLKKRGYNQSEILAKNLGKKFNLPVKNILVRTRETKPQYGLKREERIENMRGAFGINPQFKPHPDPLLKGEGKQGEVLLMDDVLTTGSTLLEATKVLKKNGFKRVYGVVLAQD